MTPILPPKCLWLVATVGQGVPCPALKINCCYSEYLTAKASTFHQWQKPVHFYSQVCCILFNGLTLTQTYNSSAAWFIIFATHGCSVHAAKHCWVGGGGAGEKGETRFIQTWTAQQLGLAKRCAFTIQSFGHIGGSLLPPSGKDISTYIKRFKHLFAMQITTQKMKDFNHTHSLLPLASLLQPLSTINLSLTAFS